MQTYLIIECYKTGKVNEIYHRFAEKGRMLPDGVEYINSWVTEDLTTCYQIMRSKQRDLLDIWIANWEDLVDFEVVRVLSSAEVAKQKLTK